MRRLLKILDVGAVLIVTVSFLAPTIASALLIYPPAALLQPGDITGTMIRNGTVTDTNISATAQIQGTKISPRGVQGSVLLSDGTNIATTTTLTFSTTTNDLEVIGGKVSATTTSFNGVTYNWPSSDGTNGQALSTNGSKTLSWTSASSAYTSSTFTAGATLTANEPVYVTQIQPAWHASENNGSTHTAGATTNDCILATVTSDNGDTITGVTYNGSSMTKEYDYQFTTGKYLYVFYIAAPNTTADSVVVTSSNGTSAVDWTFGDITNCNTTTPFAGVAESTGTGSSFTISTTTLSKGVMLFDALAIQDGSQYITGATGGGHSAFLGGVSNGWNGQYYGGQDIFSQTFTLSGSDTWGDIALGINTATSTIDVLPSSTAATTTASDFVGFTNAAAAAGASVSVVTGGALTGFTGLTLGSQYYANDTAGTFGTSPGTYSRKIGIASGTTTMLITNNW